MDTPNTWSVNLHLDEVVALISLTRATTWPGLVLPEKVEDQKKTELLNSGIRSLTGSGYLAQSPAGKPYIHSGLMLLISIITKAEKILLAQRTKTTAQRWLFFSANHMVEQEFLDDSQCLCLTAVKDAKELTRRTITFFDLESFVSNHQAEFRLNLVALDNPAADEASIRSKLSKAGVPQESIPLLEEIICGNKQFNSLQKFDKNGSEDLSTRISWFCSTQGIWQVLKEDDSVNENWVAFKPTSSGSIQNRLREVLD